MNQYICKIKEIAFPNKYTKWYCNIIEKALLRIQDRHSLQITLGYVEKHHILPKSFDLGGLNNIHNLVFLTTREHFIAHVLLIKMFNSTFKQKMMFALINMKGNVNNKRYFNSRLYSLMRLDLSGKNNLFYGKVHSEETKRKLSKIATINNKGENNPMFGKRHSEKTKHKISVANKGKLLGIGKTQKTKEKMSKAQKGKIVSIETRQKISNNNKGKTVSKETRKKMSLSHIGQKRSDITKKNISLSKIGNKNPFFGKHHSDKTKTKISKKSKLQDRSTIIKSVQQINPITNQVIKIWTSIVGASKELGINNTSISLCCKKFISKDGYLKKLAGGFKWEYVNK